MRLAKAVAGAALLSLAGAASAAPESCALPGALIAEDPAGDSTIAPTGEGFGDILTVHGAELPGSGALTFTFKVASLATLPPNTAWILRFATETLPADGNEDWFVAMVTLSDGFVRFVYGADGFQYGVPAGEPRQFYVQGELNAASAYAADGTITLVLDRSAVPSLEPGLEAFNIIPSVRLVTPAEDGVPFFTNADNNTILDDAPSGFYTIAGEAACGKLAARSTPAGFGGALPLSLLSLLLVAALRRR